MGPEEESTLFLRAAIATSMLLAALAPAAGAQVLPGLAPGRPPAPVPLPDTSGLSVVVPWRGGYVSVPLSATGSPAAAAGMGFLRVEMDTPDTRIAIDGQDAGPAASPGEVARVLLLPAGVHRVELVGPGPAVWAVAVEILPDQTSVVRWRPGAEMPVTAESAGDGYQVIPPRATSPERVPVGGGYFVVPRP
jgi:hypothetical protein